MNNESIENTKGGEDMKTTFAVFEDKNDAENALKNLNDDGFNPENISVVMRDDNHTNENVDDKNTGMGVGQGAAGGAATGAVVGGIAGFLAGTVLPGLAGFLIGGPIGAALGLTGVAATTVSGAATGAVAGGLIGALMGMGLNRQDAEHYQSRVQQGAILLAVPSNDNDEGRVSDILESHHAGDIKTVNTNVDDVEQHHQHHTSGVHFE